MFLKNLLSRLNIQAESAASPIEPPLASRLLGTTSHALFQALFLAYSLIAILLALALFSYHPEDLGWSAATSAADSVHNLCGPLGAWFSDKLLYTLGYPTYLLPMIAMISAVRQFRLYAGHAAYDPLQVAAHIIGGLSLFTATSILSWMHFETGSLLPATLNGAGGILGTSLGEPLQRLASPLGGTVIALALFLLGVTFYTSVSWLALAERIGRSAWTVWRLARKLAARSQAPEMQQRDEMQPRDLEESPSMLSEAFSPAFDVEPLPEQGLKVRQERDLSLEEELQKRQERDSIKIELPISNVVPSERSEREKQKILFEEDKSGVLPPVHLLDAAPTDKVLPYKDEALEALSRMVENKLKDFGILVKVTEVCPGPVVTRFEIDPAPGVKVSQISNLSKDLARSLSVISVRIVDIIPGKSVIGLEIPNERREIVYLSEVIGSREYEAMKTPLTLGLGKDIGGRIVVVDLAKMPHLLVAGTTGAGKSVALNAMILSLLYKSSAEHVRMIMIDPKMLELSVYEGIPHLLTPVVTDMKEAANALRWSVAEMERRYQLMAALGVRNINGFNQKIERGKEAGKALLDPMFKGVDPDAEPPELVPLPHIVIIVDELADMMMTVGKKVEELIARLAQKARAAGVHLILATQRPSVDVITGLIKANIPTRISFQVSSKIDSRTILDQMGAENLLGHGDMLYLPVGSSIPERVHGAFVSDDEVHRVVEEIRAPEPNYIDEIVMAPSEGGAASIPGVDAAAGDAQEDALYDEAVRIVLETRKSSISAIQRHLRIGYNRAARLVEDMERNGLLSPPETNGSRRILVSVRSDTHLDG
ncbi:MAG: DNA translocase FtsK [Candidatus Eutrophobiaceae bacterium]